MLKRWPTLLGLLLFVRPVWDGIKGLLDWYGRYDLIASHLHDFGVQAVIDFILNPPAWTVWPSMFIGGLFIWWDAKRKETPDLSFEQKLLAGFYFACAVLGATVTGMYFYLTYSPPPPPPPRPVEVQKPPPPPPPAPKPPWVSADEIEAQHKLGRTLLIYSPQELVALFDGGQDLSAYIRNWIKIDNAITTLPIPETIDKKEYYTVAVDPDAPAAYSLSRTRLYFDSKKWGGTLIGLRKSTKLRAVCMFAGFNQQKPAQPLSFYVNTLIGMDCDLL